MSNTLKELREQLENLNEKGCFDGWTSTVRVENKMCSYYARMQARLLGYGDIPSLKVYYEEYKKPTYKSIMEKLDLLEKEINKDLQN